MLQRTFEKVLIVLAITSVVIALSSIYVFIVGANPIMPLHIVYFIILVISFLDSIYAWGIIGGLSLFLLAFFIGLFFEIIGVLYGVPFGKYHYTEKIPAKIIGLVPPDIPLYWFVIIHTSIRITNVISGESILGSNNLYKRVMISFVDGLCAVSWDLIMDPIMVNVYHVWVWEKPSGLYGIPLTNFIGWIIVVFITSFTFRTIFHHISNPRELITPALMYFLLWLVMFLTAIYYGTLYLTPVGSFGMLGFLTIYGLRLRSFKTTIQNS